MEKIKMHLSDGLSVTVIPDIQHEFLMHTKDVASGYGVAIGTLRGHRYNLKDELIEGKHFIGSVRISNGADKSGSTLSTMWTKAGIVRLGFYIKSERAKLFRDWVEQLVINYLERKLPQLPETPKRKHNRLTPERLLDIMNDVCQIQDHDLRTRIAGKIMG